MKTTEYRVIGPPGTGKTTYLAENTERAIAVHGSTNIYIASLTRTAAREIAERVKGKIPKRNVGTLHSLAYRALDKPELTIDKIDEWNKHITKLNKPSYKLTNTEDIDIDKSISNTISNGDNIKMKIGKYRARIIDKEKWDYKSKDWFEEWTEWKNENDLMDFTDLIEVSLETVDVLPGDPHVFFLDEAQDMDKLEMELARKWGEKCIKFIVVGDPMQNLYEWRGSDPDVFYTPKLPKNRYRILSRSYRIPSKILNLATDLINSSKKNRDVVDYKPDYEGGEIGIINSTYRFPQTALKSAREWISQEESVMYLASCSYMLREAINACLEMGIPFHNPYRSKRGDWNPIRITKNSTANVLYSFYRPLMEGRAYTYDEFYKWILELNSKKIGLMYGAKKHIKDMLNEMSEQELNDFVDFDDIYTFFDDEAIIKQVFESNDSLNWYISNMITSKRRTAKKLQKMIEGGHDPFNPKLIIGTIHSIKGGQADRVIIAPDLSKKFIIQLIEDGSQVTRMFYVAVTRAKKGVYCMMPESNKYFNLEKYVTRNKRE